METEVRLSLNTGVRLADEGDGQVAFESPPTAFRPRLTLRQVTPGLLAALRGLEGEGAPTGRLAGGVAVTEGGAGMGKLFHYLGRLDAIALLTRTLLLDGEAALRLRPISPYLRWNEQAADEETPYVLSRFTLARSLGGVLLLENPRGHADVQLLSPAAVRAFGALARPRTAAELAADTGVDAETALVLLRFLVNAGAAVADPERKGTPENDDPVLAQWAVADLYFHTRSRLGRHADPYGGTFPFKGVLDPPPVVRETHSSPAVPLFRPDLDALASADVPFSQVMEKRASLRAHGEPITAEQLGEFLYRAARVKRQSGKASVSFRPAPSAGALHPLEIYPVVGECRGIDPGLYHYDPLGHALHLVRPPDEAVRTLLQLGGVTAMMPAPPQVLLLVAARFQRVQNKYQAVAYAAILKDVGALYTTFYLVATAMGLAPCGLGGGHSDLFAQAAGLDYLKETTVGEFVLGTIGPGAWDAAGGEEWHKAHPAPKPGA